MEYNMILDDIQHIISKTGDKEQICDRKDIISNKKGFEMKINNVFMDKIHLHWAEYTSNNAKTYKSLTRDEAVVAYFCQRGACTNEKHKQLNIQRGNSILHLENAEEYNFKMDVDKGIGQFFEVSICPNYFFKLFSDNEYLIEQVFENKPLYCNYFQDVNLSNLITDIYIRKEKFHGKMKELYLESKITELLLLQIDSLTEKKRRTDLKLTLSDIDAIYQAKSILDNNFTYESIPQLALLVGINQTKLKAGFKEMFGNTIFDYLTKIRMIKARQLLMETELPLTIIANKTGYQYAQHFISAFKRYFSYTPGELRKQH